MNTEKNCQSCIYYKDGYCENLELKPLYPEKACDYFKGGKMIKILNDLKEYCEDCPYMVLIPCESLGSGKLAYTCKYKRICERCVEKITDASEKGVLNFGDQDTLMPAT